MGSFVKASKAKAKLRAALFGPSGSGKTMSSLRIATGLGGRVAFIDSERGSASKYADRFDFDVCDLEDKTIRGYSAMIKEAGQAGYNILIIDSLSHAWQELLEEVEQLAKTKYRGNTWSAWSEGTPKQRRLVDAILDFPGHVLATMRSKTEWQSTKDDRGKSTPQRVGLAPEQGKGIEYEFDLLLEVTPEHYATVIKDRTGKYQDVIMDRPGEDFGRELAAWLNEGEAPALRLAADGAVRPPASVAPAVAEDPWTKLSAKVRASNEEWVKELDAEGIEHEARVPHLPLIDVNRLINHVCTTAVEAGLLDPAAINKPGKPDVRDPARAKAACLGLFVGKPRDTKTMILDYIKGKRSEARAALRIPDPEAEDAVLGAGTETASTGG